MKINFVFYKLPFLNLIEQYISLMFQNTYQSGFLSILYSIGSKPLQIWDKSSTKFHNSVHNGHIKRLTDQDIQSSVL